MCGWGSLQTWNSFDHWSRLWTGCVALEYIGRFPQFSIGIPAQCFYECYWLILSWTFSRCDLLEQSFQEMQSSCWCLTGSSWVPLGILSRCDPFIQLYLYASWISWLKSRSLGASCLRACGLLSLGKPSSAQMGITCIGWQGRVRWCFPWSLISIEIALHGMGSTWCCSITSLCRWWVGRRGWSAASAPSCVSIGPGPRAWGNWRTATSICSSPRLRPYCSWYCGDASRATECTGSPTDRLQSSRNATIRRSSSGQSSRNPAQLDLLLQLWIPWWTPYTSSWDNFKDRICHL